MTLQRFLLLDPDKLENAIEQAVRAVVKEILAGEVSIFGDDVPESPGLGALGPGERERSLERVPPPPGKYRIGTALDEYSYADVIDRELQAEQFSQAMALDVIREKVWDLAPRHRDSVRRSLDNDDRFRRMRDHDGVWWQRVDPRQLEIDEEPSEEGNPRTE